MKFSIKTSFILAALAMACADPDAPSPVPASAASNLTADVSFINAVADGPAGGLDFYVNNKKIGDAKVFLNGVGHTTSAITTNGVGANTNFRVKGNGGNIGGVLGSNDLIYRAGNNNSNNFVATATTTSVVSRYTLIALDSINRPAPVRKLNALAFGDTTFYNKANGQYVSTVERKAMSVADRANLVAIGTVPLGSSDPGGPRFLLLTDTYPATIGTTTTESAIRFINVSPNAPSLYARLKWISGTGVTTIYIIASPASYIMAFPTFTPSVGSRATASAFTLRATAGNTYNLEIATDAAFTSIISTSAGLTFTTGKVYTIVASGVYGKTDSRKLAGGVVQQN